MFKTVNTFFAIWKILALGVGILFAAYPKAGWYLETGWKFKGAEPSKLVLIVNRVMGVIFIAIALAFIIGF